MCYKRLIVTALLYAAPAVSQTLPVLPPGPKDKLAFLIPNFIQSAAPNTPPWLQSLIPGGVNPSFASLNSAIATQLSNLPLPSPASAIRLGKEDELTGLRRPLTRSLGPVLAERADTIGKNKVLFAVTFQRFHFDRIDDLDLRSFEVGIPFNTPAGEGVVTAAVNLSLDIAQTTAYLTYGITDWLDASLAVPFVNTSLSMRVGLSLMDPVSRQTAPLLPPTPIRGQATGFGDTIIRIKALGSKFEKRNVSTALVVDVRLPTGDEFNYHGAGAYGIKPFFAVSFFKWARVSPHVNTGYQWNGSSYLASPYATEKRQLPGHAFYVAGLDGSVSERLTVALDYMDQYVLNVQRTVVVPAGTYKLVEYPTNTRRESSVAAGFKLRLRSKVKESDPELALTGNFLVRLNASGLNARVTPLFGLSYVR